MPQLAFTTEAREQLEELANDGSQAARLKAVKAALGKMQTNLRSPCLQTHVFHGRVGPDGQKVFEAYAQNHTPGAFRIFFCYKPPPPKDVIIILAITDHP